MNVQDIYHLWRARIAEHLKLLTPPDAPEDYDWYDVELQAERDRLMAMYFIFFSLIISAIIFLVAWRGVRWE